MTNGKEASQRVKPDQDLRASRLGKARVKLAERAKYSRYIFWREQETVDRQPQTHNSVVPSIPVDILLAILEHVDKANRRHNVQA
jgi:hypothetical protein